MEGQIFREGLKRRHRRPEVDRTRAPQEPRKGLEHRRKHRGRQHLPFLDLSLPYTTDELLLALEDDDPIIAAEVRNNGNAPAMMPLVELITSPLLILVSGSDPPTQLFQWKTMGITSAAPLYPHQAVGVSVSWDWSQWPYAKTSQDRRWLAILFNALCYDPILDPRPKLDGSAANQSDFHKKVVSIQSLGP